MKHISTIRLLGKFVSLVKEYQRENDLSQQEIADRAGMQRSHLCAMLNGDSARPLTAYYIEKFLRRGIFTVDDIYDGKADTEKEGAFWDQMGEAENYSLLGKIARMRKAGIDVEGVLEKIYPNI